MANLRDNAQRSMVSAAVELLNQLNMESETAVDGLDEVIDAFNNLLVDNKPRLMLTIYVESLEDAQRVFTALEWLKSDNKESNPLNVDDPISSLDWDQAWEEAKE